MLSHDNLSWSAHVWLNTLFSSKPELICGDHRQVSYLPLNHIGGFKIDVLNHLRWGFECYFARPDAIAGTLR
jgi:hypothetical protein